MGSVAKRPLCRVAAAAQGHRRLVRIQRKSIAVLVDDRHRTFDQQRPIRTNSNRNIAHKIRTFSNRKDCFSRGRRPPQPATSLTGWARLERRTRPRRAAGIRSPADQLGRLRQPEQDHESLGAAVGRRRPRLAGSRAASANLAAGSRGASSRLPARELASSAWLLAGKLDREELIRMVLQVGQQGHQLLGIDFHHHVLRPGAIFAVNVPVGDRLPWQGFRLTRLSSGSPCECGPGRGQ